MLRDAFIKKMLAIEHFEVVLMFKPVKNPPTVKSPSPTLLVILEEKARQRSLINEWFFVSQF